VQATPGPAQTSPAPAQTAPAQAADVSAPANDPLGMLAELVDTLTAITGFLTQLTESLEALTDQLAAPAQATQFSFSMGFKLQIVSAMVEGARPPGQADEPADAHSLAAQTIDELAAQADAHLSMLA
jgi:hypothetical protein